jgi:hypothetical protein
LLKLYVFIHKEFNVMPDILSSNHWTLVWFFQRMTTKQWKQILLNEQDRVIFQGHLITLKAKRLGSGVVEVSKDKKELNALGYKDYLTPAENVKC